MFYYLSQWLLKESAGTEWASRLSPLRLFTYITVRSAGAAITALLLSLWLGPKVIRALKKLKFGQDYADVAEQTGDIKARILSKKGTPTMGAIRRHHAAHHNMGIMMHCNMNLTFPLADWAMGTSDLRRGLLGHLFNGYENQVASLYAGMDLRKNF